MLRPSWWPTYDCAGLELRGDPMTQQMPPPPNPGHRGCLQLFAAGLGGLMLVFGLCVILIMGNPELRDRPSPYSTLRVGAVPCRGAWGTTPSSPRAVVHEIRQRNPHTPVIEQGRANLARCRGGWAHSLSADLGRIASSLQPDLIYSRHNLIAEAADRTFLSFSGASGNFMPPLQRPTND